MPDDNPFPGSLVYSIGHRNPQGIAWDADGQLWAAEFGQNTWDEFNRIEAGANYGWPVVEGASGQTGFIDPVLQWPTDEASPSGLTYVDGTFFLAALRGERVWAIYPEATAGRARSTGSSESSDASATSRPAPTARCGSSPTTPTGAATRSRRRPPHEVRLVPLEEG